MSKSGVEVRKLTDMKRNELLSLLTDASTHMKKVDQSRSKIITIKTKQYWSFALLGFLFITFVGLMIGLSVEEGIMPISVGIIIFVGGLLELLLIFNKLRKRNGTKINELQHTIETFTYTPSVQLIPKKYRSRKALKNMKRYIENGRAECWGGCVNLWEGEKHRKRMEDLMSSS